MLFPSVEILTPRLPIASVPWSLIAQCDWRLAIIDELGTILIGPEAAPGQATTCSSAPCIDPAFAAVGGPTSSSISWSASTFAGNPSQAWAADFFDGEFGTGDKNFDLPVRAVRAGSCN